jgi:hypothetical protein
MSSPIEPIFIELSVYRLLDSLKHWSLLAAILEMHKNPSCARISLMEMDSMLGGEKQHRVTK